MRSKTERKTHSHAKVGKDGLTRNYIKSMVYDWMKFEWPNERKEFLLAFKVEPEATEQTNATNVLYKA